MTPSKLLTAGFAFMLALAGCSPGRSRPVTEQELVRRSQELVDAVAIGDRRPWEKYFAPDCMFFDERGRNMDKKALVADQVPLPAGYSGSIKVVNARSRIYRETAVLSYDLDETEIVFGQKLKARYHETDTWLLRNGDWLIVAAQVLRYYEDPAPGRIDPRRFTDYAGTYELAPGKTTVVSLESGNLSYRKPGRPRQTLIPEAGDIFFCKGVEGREVFRRDDRGRVDAFIERRNNEDIVWSRVR